MTVDVIERTVPCPRCGHTMRSALVKTTIWRHDRLFIVEDIPAEVCDLCLEQFYDEQTTDALRRLTEEGFSSAQAKRELLVPIFSLQDSILTSVPSQQQLEPLKVAQPAVDDPSGRGQSSGSWEER